MYRVERQSEQTWAVRDESDALLFSGTMRQCEDWLDHRQNLQRDGWWKRLGRLIARCCSRNETTSTDNESAEDGEKTEKITPNSAKRGGAYMPPAVV